MIHHDVLAPHWSITLSRDLEILLLSLSRGYISCDLSRDLCDVLSRDLGATLWGERTFPTTKGCRRNQSGCYDNHSKDVVIIE